MKIQKRLIASYVMTISLVIASGIIGLITTQKNIRYIQKDAFHYEQIAAVSTEISSYVKRAEGHALLYLIFERAIDREKFYARVNVLSQKISDLIIIDQDTPANQSIQEITRLQQVLLKKGDAIISLVDRAKDNGEKFDAKAREQLITEFHECSSSLREASVKIALQHFQELKEAGNQSSRASGLTTGFFILETLGTILILFFIGRWHMKYIARPIIRLSKTMERVQQLDPTREAEDTTPDELGHVAQTLNHMMDNLVDTKAKMVQSAKLASLGEMAAGVSHELNQPISVINLSAELAEEALERKDYEDILPLLRSIQGQANRASNIMEHMKLFARDSGSHSYSIFNVNDAINNVLLLIGEQIRLRNITIDKQLDTDLPNLTGNPIQIEQVISNLIINARNAMEKSAVKKLTIHTFCQNSRAIVEIRDTGIGMTEAVLDKIFEPFYTTSEVGQGTGLGLSISAGIVAEHQGEINVESTLGEGTCFRVEIPISAI